MRWGMYYEKCFKKRCRENIVRHWSTICMLDNTITSGLLPCLIPKQLWNIYSYTSCIQTKALFDGLAIIFIQSTNPTVIPLDLQTSRHRWLVQTHMHRWMHNAIITQILTKDSHLVVLFHLLCRIMSEFYFCFFHIFFLMHICYIHNQKKY